MKMRIILSAVLASVMCMAAQAQFFNLPAQRQPRQEQRSDNNPMEKEVQKLVFATAMISRFYVDTVDIHKQVEDAINGMLSKLDPHSAYSTPKETKQLNEPLSGSFEGIGVQFNMLEDTLLVIQPVPKGPSEKVGILAGDRIVAVNDTAIAGVKMSREEIMGRLRGPKNTIAHLSIVRRGIRDTLSFDVKRDKIPVNSVDAAYMVTPTIGLVRFNNFAQTTHQEIVDAINNVAAQLFAGIYSVVCVTGIRKVIIGGGIEALGNGFLQRLRFLAKRTNGNLLMHGLTFDYGRVMAENCGIGVAEYFIDKKFEIGRKPSVHL